MVKTLDKDSVGHLTTSQASNNTAAASGLKHRVNAQKNS